MTLQKTDSLEIPGTLTETSLELPNNLDLESWVRIGATLKRMARSIQWWVGDWLAYGEAHYGEEAFQAVDRADQTFANWAWVCRKIEPSRRREEVGFSVHAELAPLEADEQDKLLEKAAVEGWTVKHTRDVLGERGGEDLVKCPECNGRGRVPKTQAEQKENG